MRVGWQCCCAAAVLLRTYNDLLHASRTSRRAYQSIWSAAKQQQAVSEVKRIIKDQLTKLANAQADARATGRYSILS